MEFCIYLVEVGSAATDAVTPEDGKALPPSVAGELGDLWVFPKDPAPPEWVSAVSANWPTAVLDGVVSARGGAIASIEVAGRVFLITFGTGYLRVDKEYIVRDFGRRTVVNCVDQDELRQVSRQAIEGNYLQAIEQTPKSANIGAYGVDADRDLLKGLAGIPRKKAFGDFLAGSDSLRGRIAGGLEHLAKILRLYLKAYNQKKIISDDLKWFDRVARETKSAIIHALEQRLDRRLMGIVRGGEVLLLLPEFIDISKTPTFSFDRIGTVVAPAIYEDPSVGDWVDWRASHKTKPATYAISKNDRMYLHVDGVSNKASYTVARCLNWVANYSGSTYMLHDATWYRIDHAFVKDLAASLRAIYKSSSGIAWPKYTGGSEGKYNQDAVLSFRRPPALSSGRV
ncbi:DUF6119 family protein [Xanthomonas euvesicatoria]|uniref:DUF6119 family protein n=2 Tax=Xanthomonas TaxID=338 RepID=UPI001C495EE0|nr:DUF6119 family protein [Xanthomonas euvesicatoria]MBV6843745.1 TIGR04141 family sporadically distributed protein [Xanthomonas campestris pv. fici]